jgi:Flp pilus assembly protein protease CpaA
MLIAIFIACCFIIGMLIVVCLELRHINKNLVTINYNNKVHRDDIVEYLTTTRHVIIDCIPDTFEYNGNKGKVYRK